MNILLCMYQFHTGGGALQVVVDLAHAARQHGHSATMLARDVPVSAQMGAERFFTGNKLQDWWRLWSRLKQERYDIVHVHDRYCSLLINLIPGAPVSVQTNHVAYRNFRRLTQFAHCVVGCSHSMDAHHAEFFGLPPERRALIPNGVNARQPDPAVAERLRALLPPAARGRRLCLTVARLNPQKGHRFLLSAIQKLPAALRQSWYFVWCGSGELESSLQQQAEALNLQEDLYFAGQTQAVAEWLSLGDAFVLPSLYEGLPLALLEAMSAGLPCLATAVDGNREALQHQHNGLLCRAEDAEDLCQALTQLLSECELRDRLGAQAQADYLQHWTFKRTWKQYEALYQRLAGGSDVERLQTSTSSSHAR